MALNGIAGQDVTMAIVDITTYSYQAVPHYHQVSGPASLYCAYILLLHFSFHFSTTYLHILLLLGVSGCLRLSQKCLMQCVAGKDILSVLLPPGFLVIRLVVIWGFFN